jgi:exopolysaccharide biosynthesis protein
MKRSFGPFVVRVLRASLVLFGLVAVSSAQDFKSVKPGVEYAEVTTEIAGQQVKMNILRLDLGKVRLDVVHAGSGIVGTEKTSVIASKYGAVAAINAGFFRLDKSPFAGEPAGLIQIDGKLLSESTNGRAALLITNDTDGCVSCTIPSGRTAVSFDHLNTYAEFWTRQHRVNISGIDRQLKENEAVYYTPEFGNVTPPSEAKVLEIIIENKRIKQVLETNGGTKIPSSGGVLTASGSKKLEISSVASAGGDAIIILGSYSDRETSSDPKVGKMKFIDVEDIVAGVPQLIKGGKIDVTWEKEKTTRSFVETRHPRTAVALLKDGRFLMITVDGRSESSGGIALADLASYLLSLGAAEAINLDGGGSTTMYLDGKVVNHPSDKEGERSVSDALIVRLRQPAVKTRP